MLPRHSWYGRTLDENNPAPAGPDRVPGMHRVESARLIHCRNRDLFPAFVPITD